MRLARRKKPLSAGCNSGLGSKAGAIRSAPLTAAAGRERIAGPMDSPQSEDNVLLANDPLDVVEHVLAAENLEFDRTDDGDLAFNLSGDWKDYELWFAWRPEGDCLQLCLSLDLNVVTEQRTAAFELISSI